MKKKLLTLGIIFFGCAHSVRRDPDPDFRVYSANRYGCSVFERQFKVFEMKMEARIDWKWTCDVVSRQELETVITLEKWKKDYEKFTIVLPLAIQMQSLDGNTPWKAVRGAYKGNTIAISISDAKADTFAHEMGHYAGLQHSNSEESIMGIDRLNYKHTFFSEKERFQILEKVKKVSN